jgi:toxin CcdB
MQFDVRRNPGRAAELAPYLIELQDDRVRVVRSVVVAPLLVFDPRDDLGRLTPQMYFEGERFLVSVAELFAMDKSRLGPVVVNLESERERIIAAIDMLFTGI